MTDRTLRKLAGIATCLVAAIAATISYEHVYHLALGQPKLAAWLMPLSVDGSFGAASAAMLSAARLGHRSPRIAQAMLALGVLATLTANAYSGSSHGIPGMALAMWPGIAFIGSTETALSIVRKGAEAVAQPLSVRDIETVTTSGRPPLSLAWPRAEPFPADSATVIKTDAERSRSRTANRTPKAAKPASRDRKAAVIVKRQPDISGAELGRKLGVSERQGRRILADMSTEGAAA
jgi:hypothetical protein